MTVELLVEVGLVVQTQIKGVQELKNGLLRPVEANENYKSPKGGLKGL